MRVFQIEQATVKALKLVYAPDAITISGVIAAPGSTVAHLADDPVVPEPPKEVPPQSFDTPDHGTTTTAEATTEDKPFSRTITFDDLRAVPGFACHSQVMVAVNALNAEVELYEGFSRSYQTKNIASAAKDNHFSPMHIGIPSGAVASFDDCGLFVKCEKAVFEFDQPYPSFAPGGAKSQYVALSVAGPDNVVAGGSQFVATYQWPDGTPVAGAEVFAESTAGYVNRRSGITDAQGQVRFTVLPLALDKGETFRLKFGFRHFTGKAEKLLVVS
jgi:hypothetical protein